MGLASKAKLDVHCNGSEHSRQVLSSLRTRFEKSAAVADLGGGSCGAMHGTPISSTMQALLIDQ